MEQKQSINFLMSGIEVAEFAVLESNIEGIKKIKFNTGLQFGVSNEVTAIVCHVTVEFLDESEKKLVKLKTDNHFKVKPEDWERFKGDDEIIIPQKFLIHISMISVSTTRGVLHCKTENTPYSGFILPLIDVNSMIQSDETFVLNP